MLAAAARGGHGVVAASGASGVSGVSGSVVDLEVCEEAAEAEAEPVEVVAARPIDASSEPCSICFDTMHAETAREVSSYCTRVRITTNN